jgi:amino acid transporter
MKIFRKKTIAQIQAQVAKGESEAEHTGLAKHLGVRDLTAFGIAAIIGAGIFSTIGNASASGGPAVIFLFIFTALACGFSAFAYAEFASLVPVSGSAYTYSYVAFGEIMAWLIGWSLIMEYAIGNIAVAISWSDYFTGLLSLIKIPALGINGIHLPAWSTMDYLTASKGFTEANSLISNGAILQSLTPNMQDAYNAYALSPTIGSLHIICDVPALLIIFIITALVYRGIKESKNVGNAMVIIKLAVVLLIIAVGVFYVDTTNWSPFAPNGVSGVLKGISAVFFAYIGFDAISTTAEECKNPQRDLPRGMMYAIIICTILYVLIALVLTGMVKYNELAVGDPLAFVFEKLNLRWMSGIIAVSAVVAMASVLLVFQLGQPRIWMSMSRDGLLPKAFSRIHPKYKTPSFATIVTGFVVAVPALFMNLTAVTDLCSIGTLFAFVLVCGGVLVLQKSHAHVERKFKIPYFNSQYVFPVLLLISFGLALKFNSISCTDFLHSRKLKDAESIVTTLNVEQKASLLIHANDFGTITSEIATNNNPLLLYMLSLNNRDYENFVLSANLDMPVIYNSGIGVFKHNIPLWIFFIASIMLAYLCYKHKLSLIPVLGLISCLFMMSEMGISNWIGFGIWLVVGLVIYASYGYRKSKLSV